MSFENFQTELFFKLNNKDPSCLKTILNNEEIIEKHLELNDNQDNINNFVDNINNIIINSNSSKNYELIEKVLYEPCFRNVLYSFVNSTVLIDAIKKGNSHAVKWLLTMDINPCIQDKDGKSALMFAAEQNFEDVIKKYFDYCDVLNMEDKNGDNVLFYSVRNPKFIESINSNNKYAVELFKSNVNINHVNRHGETILTYCCKNKIFKPVNPYLILNGDINPNIYDEDGYTASMYLTENGRYRELLYLHRKNCNLNHANLKGESALSILINKYYSYDKEQDQVSFKKYVRIMNAFVKYNVNFNIPVDADRNTPLMIMLMVNDIKSIKYCVQNVKNLNLSMKNKYGESVISLCYKLKRYEIISLFEGHPTFDYHYKDIHHQNNLLILSAISKPSLMKKLLENHVSIINDINDKGENALIVSTKNNSVEAIDILLQYGIEVNHQDKKGNTALHYAVDIEQPDIIQKLITNHADMYIKNNEGKSPLDLVNEMNRKDILCAMINPSKIITNKTTNPTKYKEDLQNYLTLNMNRVYPNYKTNKKMEKAKAVVYAKTDDKRDRKSVV